MHIKRASVLHIHWNTSDVRVSNLRCRSPGGGRSVAPPWHFSEVATDSIGGVTQYAMDSRSSYEITLLLHAKIFILQFPDPAMLHAEMIASRLDFYFLDERGMRRDGDWRDLLLNRHS